jgi:Peptidase M50B-like
MVEDRLLTAHHEAGHAVAALMRGGSQLRSITIEPTTNYLGHTGWRGKPCDSAFVTYAGPWAEARAQWEPPALDDEDDDGYTFEDYVTAAFLRNAAGDGEDYRRAQEADAAMYGPEFAHLAYGREEHWSRELEQSWSAIRQLAAMLMDGPVSAEAATQLLDTLGV